MYKKVLKKVAEKENKQMLLLKQVELLDSLIMKILDNESLFFRLCTQEFEGSHSCRRMYALYQKVTRGGDDVSQFKKYIKAYPEDIQIVQKIMSTFPTT